MCSIPAAIGVGLETYGNYLGQKSTAAAAQAQMDAQAKAAITEMNYAFQNYEIERANAYDSAVAEITKTRLNALELNSQVKAAVNENMSGRTANMLIRTTEGSTARTVASEQDKYALKSNEIDLNKEYKQKSTKAYLENLNASAPKMPSRLANGISFMSSALGAYTQTMNTKSSIESKGGKFNRVTGGSK